ncbi:MAG: hypothetical protein UV38_C0001G0201 [candidate division TM6 bacterium GW2011_GWE2_42_60]|nr:MAG: hypothetical protein UV38_C0001G0201 [candidate division TM6 bacterium GW2011_GWE2_42_60]HBY05604.1 hypothetical protein [Candidatus Dependentiae bacterium]
MKKRFLLVLLALLPLFSASTRLCGYSFYSRIDPYPVFTSANPYGSFTHFEDCEQLYHVRVSFSGFRQNAWRAGAYHDEIYYNQLTVTPNPKSMTSPDEVELGDMLGKWNILGLFYQETDGSTSFKDGDPTLVKPNVSIQSMLTQKINAVDPENTNNVFDYAYYSPNKFDGNLGVASVPLSYRKYGGRFEMDFCSCFDFGAMINLSFAQAQQCPMSPPALVGVTPAQTSPSIFIDQSSASSDAKKTDVSKTFMSCDKIKKMADALGYSINPFCDSDIESCTLSVYWRHCFETNCPPNNPEKSGYPWLTVTPFIVAEATPFTGKKKPTNMLFGIPFGNGGHFSYGLMGGLTINFLETVLIGFDAGVTAFSREGYANWPVPTHCLQAGIFPRRADLSIEPGNNWCTGAGFWANHFLDNFSASVQMRYVHHCKDSIEVIRVEPITVPKDAWYPRAAGVADIPAKDIITTDDFVTESIAIPKMERESCFSTFMVNSAITYDISQNLQLGIFWQAPVRQRYAYRPTTVMGSFVLSF